MRISDWSSDVCSSDLRRLGAIRLASGPDADAGPGAIAAALLDGIRAHGLDLLPWSDTALALRERAHFAADHGGADLALDDASLLDRADQWLGPLLTGKRRLDQIEPGALTDALSGIIGRAEEDKSELQQIMRL